MNLPVPCDSLGKCGHGSAGRAEEFDTIPQRGRAGRAVKDLVTSTFRNPAVSVTPRDGRHPVGDLRDVAKVGRAPLGARRNRIPARPAGPPARRDVGADRRGTGRHQPPSRPGTVRQTAAPVLHVGTESLPSALIHPGSRKFDERGELRGLLILLGLVLALAAVVFGFGLRAHKPTPVASVKATAGAATTTQAPGATTTAPAATPTSVAQAGPAPAQGQPAPTSPPAATRTTTAPAGGPTPTSPPVTAPPATSPPATSPPATQPPATAPPATAAPPASCSISFANPNPPRGPTLDFTVSSNQPTGSISGSYGPVGVAGNSYGVTGSYTGGSAHFTGQRTPDDTPAGTQYRMTLSVGGQTKSSCSATFTTS